MATFAQQVGSWANSSERRIRAVHKRSLEKLAMEMTRTKAEGGNVPFQSGNLYRSFVASTSGLPKTSTSRSSGSNATAVIATLPTSSPIWFAFQAAYARRQNYGFVGADSLGRVYNQQGHYFVERAIAMWPQIVKDAVQELRSNANS